MSTVDLPRVNMAFTDPKTGFLTEYGRAMLGGLRNRTGGSDGVDITKLQAYVIQQLQDDREAPLPADPMQQDPAMRDEAPPALQTMTGPSDESPPNVVSMQPEDVGIAGLVFELLARLHTAEKRIIALENNP